MMSLVSKKTWFVLGAVSLLAIGGMGACSSTDDSSKFGSSPGGDNTAGSGGGSSLNSGGSAGSVNLTQDAGDNNNMDWENCGKATYGAKRVPANVLLVMDSSGSMSKCPDGGDSCSENKWKASARAIDGALTAAPPELGVGLVFFPAGKYKQYAGCQLCLQNAMQNNGYPTDANCAAILKDCGCHDAEINPDVPVDQLGTTLASIKSKLSGKSPGGNTPTLAALQAAYYYMKNVLKRDGDKYVLLLTDGDPSVHTPRQPIPNAPPGSNWALPEAFNECKTVNDILAEAHKAATTLPAVNTFVVGSPGVEHFGVMSQLAKAGGTAKTPNCDTTDNCNQNNNCCYYQIGKQNFATDLQAVLSEIAGKLATCTFAIPAATGEVDPDMVNVLYKIPGQGDNQLMRDPAHQDGWDYTDDTHTKIHIYGHACDEIKKNTESEVTIILGCKTVVK